MSSGKMKYRRVLLGDRECNTSKWAWMIDVDGSWEGRAFIKEWLCPKCGMFMGLQAQSNFVMNVPKGCLFVDGCLSEVE